MRWTKSEGWSKVAIYINSFPSSTALPVVSYHADQVRTSDLALLPPLSKAFHGPSRSRCSVGRSASEITCRLPIWGQVPTNRHATHRGLGTTQTGDISRSSLWVNTLHASQSAFALLVSVDSRGTWRDYFRVLGKGCFGKQAVTARREDRESGKQLAIPGCPTYMRKTESLTADVVVVFVRYCPVDDFSREDTAFTAPLRVISYWPYSMQRSAVPKMRTLVSLSFDSGNQKSPTFW